MKARTNEFDAYSKELGERWIRMHFQSSIILSVLVSILEFTSFFMFKALDEVYVTDFQYLLMYWITPSSINLGVLLISYFFIKCSNDTTHKSTIVSFMMTLIIFVIYTVHKEYSILDIGFAAAIAITIIYSNRRVTTATFIWAIVLKAVSEVLFTWEYRYGHVEIGADTMNPYIDFSMSFVGLTLCYIVILLIERIEQEKRIALLQSKRESLFAKQESLQDSLTGVYNRRALNSDLARLDSEYDGEYALVMIDFDDFKSVNDMYGHRTGDMYLTQFWGGCV